MMGGTASSAAVSEVAIDWVTGRMYSQAHASPTWRTPWTLWGEHGLGTKVIKSGMPRIPRVAGGSLSGCHHRVAESTVSEPKRRKPGPRLRRRNRRATPASVNPDPE